MCWFWNKDVVICLWFIVSDSVIITIVVVICWLIMLMYLLILILITLLRWILIY